MKLREETNSYREQLGSLHLPTEARALAIHGVQAVACADPPCRSIVRTGHQLSVEPTRGAEDRVRRRQTPVFRGTPKLSKVSEALVKRHKTTIRWRS